MILTSRGMIITIIILLSMIASAGYFYLQQRFLQPAESVVFFTDTEELATLYPETSETITVVYFWDSRCPCNAGVLPHFNKLITSYANNGVRFLLADISSSPSTRRPDIPLVETSKLETMKTVVTHTPSTAVWDRQGELVYYGAHNLGYVCNAETSFIEPVLSSLFNKQVNSALNTVGEGCFCARH